MLRLWLQVNSLKIEGFRLRAGEDDMFMRTGLRAKGQRIAFYFFLPFPSFLRSGTRCDRLRKTKSELLEAQSYSSECNQSEPVMLNEVSDSQAMVEYTIYSLMPFGIMIA